jgi:GntR family transcriptional regulator
MLSLTLNITVNPDSSVPVRDQIVEQIGWQIAAGVLPGNEKLPSIRALASKLGIHQSIVNSAYNELATIGMLSIRHGSGVRVIPSIGLGQDGRQNDLDTLFMSFIGKANALGYSRDEIAKCYKNFAERRPISKIIIVDRNPDFHPVILAELAPHFSLPVVAVTSQELHDDHSIFDNALVLTSLYHFLSLQTLPLDPTRFMICNIEPVHEAIDAIKSLLESSIVLFVSVSQTLLDMGVNIAPGLSGDAIAVRTLLADDTKELQYMTKFAKAIICDLPSKSKVVSLAGNVPVTVLKLYSAKTIELIEERLAEGR